MKDDELWKRLDLVIKWKLEQILKREEANMRTAVRLIEEQLDEADEREETKH